MKIEKKKLTDLKPLEKNVRNHGDAQIREMVRAVKAFGQTRPMVVDEEGHVLIGNCLYSALVQMGSKTGECYVVKGLSEATKKKMILSDNKIYRLGTDNFDVINDFLTDIAKGGDFEIPGFDADIVEKLVADIENIDEQVNTYGTVDATAYAPSTENDRGSQAPLAPPELADSDNPQGRQYIICPKCGELIYLD